GLLTDDGLSLIYLSILSSIGAAVVLFLAFRRARPTHEKATEPPAPLLPELGGDEEADVSPMAEPTRVHDAVDPLFPPEPEPEPEPAPVAAATGDEWSTDDLWSTDDDWAEAGEFEVEFPIADYDELSVAE